IRNGISGPITVNGIEFVQPMPGIPTLTDLEIAEIMTYIYNTWGRDRGRVDVTLGSETLNNCPPPPPPPSPPSFLFITPLTLHPNDHFLLSPLPPSPIPL